MVYLVLALPGALLLGTVAWLAARAILREQGKQYDSGTVWWWCVGAALALMVVAALVTEARARQAAPAPSPTTFTPTTAHDAQAAQAASEADELEIGYRWYTSEFEEGERPLPYDEWLAELDKRCGAVGGVLYNGEGFIERALVRAGVSASTPAGGAVIWREKQLLEQAADLRCSVQRGRTITFFGRFG